MMPSKKMISDFIKTGVQQSEEFLKDEVSEWIDSSIIIRVYGART